LAEKVQVDLNAESATRLDTNHAPDHWDFVTRQRDVQHDL
jgi:hypothetical protein